MTDVPVVLGLDVGGTTLGCGVVCDGAVAGDVVVAPWGNDGTEATIEQVVGRVRAAWDGPDISGVAAAVPGPFDLATGTSRMTHKLVDVHGRSLTPTVHRATGLEPVWCNDADAFGLGAAAALASDADRVLGLTCGTGIGSGFVVDGRLGTDADGVPNDGEIWNLPFRGSIVEDHVSTASLLAAVRVATRDSDELDESDESDEAAATSVAAVADHARAGSVPARRAFEAYGDALGHALVPVIAGFRPATVVIGGGIAGSADLFLPAMQHVLGAAAPVSPSVLATDRRDLALLGAAVFHDQEVSG